eukprot:2264903-Pleurochrysis_carterae.AAC.1
MAVKAYNKWLFQALARSPGARSKMQGRKHKAKTPLQNVSIKCWGWYNSSKTLLKIREDYGKRSLFKREPTVVWAYGDVMDSSRLADQIMYSVCKRLHAQKWREGTHPRRKMSEEQEQRH